jgi:hypothetical protein
MTSATLTTSTFTARPGLRTRAAAALVVGVALVGGAFATGRLSSPSSSTTVVRTVTVPATQAIQSVCHIGLPC